MFGRLTHLLRSPTLRLLLLVLALATLLPGVDAQEASRGTNTVKAVLNDPSTGTTLWSLAKITSTGAVIAGTGDTNIPLYVVTRGGGTTGSAMLNLSGVTSCRMDATASNVRGQYVVASPTVAGDCHAQAAAPSNGIVIGQMDDNATTAGSLALIDTKIIAYVPGSGAGTGTVTSVTITPPPEYTVTGSPITTAGTIAFVKATQTANSHYAGPASGSAAAPTFRALVKADLPAALASTGTVTPTTLAGDVNDYAGCTNGVCRINGGAADRLLTGLTAGTGGDIIDIQNVGTTNALTLKDQSASSSAVNRFLFGGDLTLFPGETLAIIYDATATRWKAWSIGIPDKYKIKPCVISVGSVSVDAPPLADDEDSPRACPNDFEKDWKITTVACMADAGTPTVTPILTAGSATSILTGACTCGAGVWAPCAVNGSPLVHSFSGTGATCSSTPCDLAVNITAAGGTAKFVQVKIKGVLQ